MANSISVKVVGLEAFRRKLTAIGSNVNRTVSRLLDDTAKEGRKLAVDGITSEWNIKPKDVRPTFKIKRSSPSNLRAELSSSGKPIPLLYFAARQTRKGVTYKIRKSQKRDLMQSGWINVLRRGRAVGIRRALSRLPIKAPAVPGVHFAWRQLWPEQLPMLNAYMRKRMGQLIEWELKRRG